MPTDSSRHVANLQQEAEGARDYSQPDIHLLIVIFIFLLFSPLLQNRCKRGDKKNELSINKKVPQKLGGG